MSKKDKKNKKNNNINNSQLDIQQNQIIENQTDIYTLKCRFVDDYGEQGELIELDISDYLKYINYNLTAAILTDFLFSKLHSIDETKIQISYDEQNYVYLNQLDQKVQLNFVNQCIKLKLRRAQMSIFQRLLRLEEENKELKNMILQMQIDKQNDLKISIMNSKNEEEEEEIEDNIIDLAILYSDPLVEMKRTIQPYQQSVSYQKEIVDLKYELQSIQKQIKIKIANLTIDNLQKVCMHNKPTILHIICHGQVDNKDKYLHFENSDYSLQKINPDDLRKILTHLEDKKPKLVFVNACNSAIVSDVFREAGIPFVVSVDQNHSILDEVAQNFSKYFYRNIIQYGKSIQDLFLNAQEITDKVIQGTKNYPCCCLHQHKPDCKWFNGDDQNPNHEDHILDCNCSQKQQQKHYNSCKEAKEFLLKYKPQSLQSPNPNQNFLFTCCCYTFQELKDMNLLYHQECQKFKLDYDPQDDFFNKPLFKSKKSGRLIDKSDFEMEKISSSLFVRKVETFNVLKILRDPNQKCISIIGKKRVGKSLFVTKLIEYSKLRGLYHDFVQEIDMKEIYYCEQIWPFFKKNSKKEVLDHLESLDGLIYFKDCDKIFEKDENNFKQLLQDLSRYTKQLKIILTQQKEYHSPFSSFYLKDYLAYDTRVYLNYLLLQENVTINKRKQYINDFLNNPKIQRTTYNIQYFSKYKNFSGIETIEDNQKQIFDEIQQDPQLFKLCCMLSFFKYGLNEQDFNILALSNLINQDWLQQIEKIIHKVDNRQTNYVAHKFQDLYEVVRGKTIGISRGRLKFFNINMREQFVEKGNWHFESKLTCLYLFSNVLTKKERKTDWKLLKFVDFSIFSLNGEVFKDILPKIKNPVIEAEDLLEQESQDRGQKINWINETSQYIYSLIDKHDLINDGMTSVEIEAIVQVVLALFFQLISLMKLSITKNFLLKPICYWGQRFFQKYLQLAPEKKLSKENQIKKAEIYLDLLLLDIQINEKNGHELIKQHFENINFIQKKIEGLDFQQVIESQLYQCKAFLLLLKVQFEFLSCGKLDLIEHQKDREQILENLMKSNQCLSNDGYSENFVYKELNATIKHKNTILLQEQKLLFEPHAVTSEDKAAVHTIQQKYIKNKSYKNICIIYETIMNHIQLQIYANQVQNGKTEAFNNLNTHIEQKYPQFKDRENTYGFVRLSIYKSIIKKYIEECSKGLIYVMHSQPLVDIINDQNDSMSSSGFQKGKKQQFKLLDQPHYSIWNYNEILRSQVFYKCKKQIKYSFLSFNRKNYNLATNSGCQIMSINSNFNEDSSLKTLQFEGSKLLEVDQYCNEDDKEKILDKISQLQNVRILILCVNNGQALKNIIQENILEVQQSQQRVIIYFPFKETCKSFDKVLICQKFQLEFFKQYLNQNNKTIKESFDIAKEQTKNFILKKFDLKKVQNINFDKVFGDVPSIYSSPDSFMDEPFKIDEVEKPQEITPLIKQSNVLEQINMDKVILKSRDIYLIKHYFNESDIRLINLYNQNNTTKTGKTTLALSFAMTMLERNLHFSGGIHFIQNRHSSLGSIQSSKQFSFNLRQSNSAGYNVNESQMNQSTHSINSNCTNITNSSYFQGGSSTSLKQTLESLNDKLFKIKSSNYQNFNAQQNSNNNYNQYNYQTQADLVLIILSGFDCFNPRQFEFLFERNFLPNYRFLNISNRKFSLAQSIYSKMFKNHEVMPYKNTLNRLVQNKIEEEEEEITSTQKKSDNHHNHNQSNKSKQKQNKSQKNQTQKHNNHNNNHNHQMTTSSPLSLLDPCPKSVNSNQIQQQISYIIQKTTPYFISQKSQNKNSSKSFSSDSTTTNYQSQLHDIQINTVNSCDAFILKGTVSEICKENKENDGFFDDLENDLPKQENRSLSNSIQLTPFSQQSIKKQQINVPSFENKQFGDFTNSGQIFEALDSNFGESDNVKSEIFKDQNEMQYEIAEVNNDFQNSKNKKKNKEFYHSSENLNSSKTENQIKKPVYSSSQDQNNIKLCTSSYEDNIQQEESVEAFQDEESEKEDLENDRSFD